MTQITQIFAFILGNLRNLWIDILIQFTDEMKHTHSQIS